MYVAPYKDRVIHQVLNDALLPILTRSFTKDTYATIKGRGPHLAMRAVRAAIQKIEQPYCLKMDVRKFYPSVNGAILKELLRRKIKCERTLWLADTVIDSAQGLPIGNLTSQLLGNFYLTELDHIMREQWGVKHYFRYCDDLVVIDPSKEFLHQVRIKTEDYLREHRGLHIKPSKQVFPVDSRGVDFLGVRFFTTHTLLRDSTKRRITRKLKYMNSHPATPEYEDAYWASVYGITKHCDTSNLIKTWRDEYRHYFSRLQYREAARLAKSKTLRGDRAVEIKLRPPSED
ncbi:MAG: RNA-directed DNA polymerase [Bacteroidales bacterium]